jgi:hypothetical protein
VRCLCYDYTEIFTRVWIAKKKMTDYPNKSGGYQAWVTDLQLIATDAPSGPKIIRECLEVAEMLIKKNVSYGDSALNPMRLFAKSDSVEQLKVRIDDKLNRIRNSQGFAGDNDIDDLIGYLILLRIAMSQVAISVD